MPTAFATLRRFVGQRKRAERCELCAAELAVRHRHLLEPATRQIACACGPCALLFFGRADGRFRLIPSDARRLDDFRLSDAQWNALNLPINLAFFFQSSAAHRPIAIYPSPAGPTESLLPLEAWRELACANPRLGAMEPDVEALLVYRIGAAREHFIVPIDECYKLVGLLRLKWRGFSGGTEAWQAIGDFFEDLRQRTAP